ncbi:MAG: methylated-DNA--[protein]-cysteine S-methyltransferase [Ammonifex sp.]|jgi:methylated-DNA-[protein]-cysteine S-methyltransferase|nr:MAG: methylated-DNA--[protein]-cysteine S-methyltransferase [Ammonifex sp.]
MTTQTIDIPGVGVLVAVWTSAGLHRLLLPGIPLQPEWSARKDVAFPNRQKELEGSLRAYFAGRAMDFAGIPLDLAGYTFFQARVFGCVRRLPYGATTTYGEVALELGRAGAARAVGQALRRNRTPLVVPCHRILACRSLGGFGAGLEWKERLLAFEGLHP